MLLKLEVVGSQAGRLGEHRSKIFGAEGGTIGRVDGNDWVLPDQFVSTRHAVIEYADGQFFVVDMNSSNGVFLNAPSFRLEQGCPYPLNTGDRLLIEPFEIHVSVIESMSPGAAVPDAPHTINLQRSPPLAAHREPVISSDPFAVEDDEPFIGTLPAPLPRGVGLGESLVPNSGASAEEPVDPLIALGLPGGGQAARVPPRAENLAGGSPLRSHFEPPRITPPPPQPHKDLSSPAPAGGTGPPIPQGYNPLAQTGAGFERDVPRSPPRPAPPPRPSPPAPRSDARPVAPRPPPHVETPPKPAPPIRSARQPPAPVPPVAASRPQPPPAARPPAARAPSPRPSPPLPAAPAAATSGAGQLDFAALLAAAGLQGVPVTPELAANFGMILKVVVDGLRDVLRAREELKDQFRLRITTYRQRENNPLKFSADTPDALYNLLVKHHPGYLGPVAAFEEAFQDLRIHQMAMLAGLRAAYESMLGTFEPDALEQKFERYSKRGGLLAGAAKQRYWELYRDTFQEIVSDADSSFSTLFGEAFGKGYEDQVRLLKRGARGQ